MQTFRIDVKKGRSWVVRTTISARSVNHALRSYGIGGRPRLGIAKSKSGKTFRAVAA